MTMMKTPLRKRRAVVLTGTEYGRLDLEALALPTRIGVAHERLCALWDAMHVPHESRGRFVSKTMTQFGESVAIDLEREARTLERIRDRFDDVRNTMEDRARLVGRMIMIAGKVSAAQNETACRNELRLLAGLVRSKSLDVLDMCTALATATTQAESMRLSPSAGVGLLSDGTLETQECTHHLAPLLGFSLIDNPLIHPGASPQYNDGMGVELSLSDTQRIEAVMRTCGKTEPHGMQWGRSYPALVMATAAAVVVAVGGQRVVSPSLRRSSLARTVMVSPAHRRDTDHAAPAAAIAAGLTILSTACATRNRVRSQSVGILRRLDSDTSNSNRVRYTGSAPTSGERTRRVSIQGDDRRLVVNIGKSLEDGTTTTTQSNKTRVGKTFAQRPNSAPAKKSAFIVEPAKTSPQEKHIPPENGPFTRVVSDNEMSMSAYSNATPSPTPSLSPTPGDKDLSLRSMEAPVSALSLLREAIGARAGTGDAGEHHERVCNTLDYMLIAEGSPLGCSRSTSSLREGKNVGVLLKALSLPQAEHPERTKNVRVCNALKRVLQVQQEGSPSILPPLEKRTF